MKKITLFILLSIFCNNAFSENSTYNANTQTVYIPTVEINGNTTLKDIHLKLREDGLLEITDFKSITPSILDDSFTVFSTGLNTDQLYINSEGVLIEIVGNTDSQEIGYSQNGQERTFTQAPGNYPEPYYGTKGNYSILIDGKIVYAKILGIPGDIEFSVGDGSISQGDVLMTDTGNTIIITGGYGISKRNSNISVFRKAPPYLPELPANTFYGEKGTYYALDSNGSIVYADLL